MSCAFRRSSNRSRNLLKSGCPSLISLCFLMHWPGMWCYFITEAGATSSASSLRAQATRLDRAAVCNNNWLSQTSPVDYRAEIKQREKFGVGRRNVGARRWRVLEGAGQEKQTSTASELIRFVTSDGARWQRSWHLHCHSVSTGLSIDALSFLYKSVRPQNCLNIKIPLRHLNVQSCYGGYFEPLKSSSLYPFQTKLTEHTVMEITTIIYQVLGNSFWFCVDDVEEKSLSL